MLLQVRNWNILLVIAFGLGLVAACSPNSEGGPPSSTIETQLEVDERLPDTEVPQTTLEVEVTTSAKSPEPMTYDKIDRPAHYAAGRRFEVIEVIEDWAQFAPNVKQGLALGSALKYLGRLWTKNDGITSSPELNLRKAQWYLDRLMGHMIDDAPEPDGDGEGFGEIMDAFDLGDDLPWDRPEQWLAAPVPGGNIDLDGSGQGRTLSSNGDILTFDLK